jgi:hypothetical protein
VFPKARCVAASARDALHLKKVIQLQYCRNTKARFNRQIEMMQFIYRSGMLADGQVKSRAVGEMVMMRGGRNLSLYLALTGQNVATVAALYRTLRSLSEAINSGR